MNRLKIAIAFVFLTNPFVVIASDLEEGGASNDEEITEVENSGVCQLLRKKISDGCYASWETIQDILDGLGTPRGATIVTSCFGISQGISNFLWAFNWQDHAGVNETAAKIIQEVGGLTSSAECFLIGVLVPIMLYKYQKHVQRQIQAANQNL